MLHPAPPPACLLVALVGHAVAVAGRGLVYFGAVPGELARLGGFALALAEPVLALTALLGILELRRRLPVAARRFAGAAAVAMALAALHLIAIVVALRLQLDLEPLLPISGSLTMTWWPLATMLLALAALRAGPDQRGLAIATMIAATCTAATGWGLERYVLEPRWLVLTSTSLVELLLVVGLVRRAAASAVVASERAPLVSGLARTRRGAFALVVAMAASIVAAQTAQALDADGLILVGSLARAAAAIAVAHGFATASRWSAPEAPRLRLATAGLLLAAGAWIDAQRVTLYVGYRDLRVLGHLVAAVALALALSALVDVARRHGVDARRIAWTGGMLVATSVVIAAILIDGTWNVLWLAELVRGVAFLAFAHALGRLRDAIAAAPVVTPFDDSPASALT